MKDWIASLLFIPLYMAPFVVWQGFPSRASFLLAAIASASCMIWLIVRARRRGYFANRVDLCLHVYVVLDVLLEGFAFEILLWGDRFGWLTTAETQALRKLALTFHDNQHFLGCTAFFVLTIGLNRLWALSVRRRQTTLNDARPAI